MMGAFTEVNQMIAHLDPPEVVLPSKKNEKTKDTKISWEGVNPQMED